MKNKINKTGSCPVPSNLQAEGPKQLQNTHATENWHLEQVTALFPGSTGTVMTGPILDDAFNWWTRWRAAQRSWAEVVAFAKSKRHERTRFTSSYRKSVSVTEAE